MNTGSQFWDLIWIRLWQGVLDKTFVIQVRHWPPHKVGGILQACCFLQTIKLTTTIFYWNTVEMTLKHPSPKTLVDWLTDWCLTSSDHDYTIENKFTNNKKYLYNSPHLIMSHPSVMTCGLIWDCGYWCDRPYQWGLL